MMRLMRNPEVIKTVGLQLALTVLAAAAAWAVNAESIPWVLLLCGLFILIYILSTRTRYKRIADLSADVDKLLHGTSHIRLDKYAEGELGILQSELEKMTVRLREQEQRLRRDKIYLADSIADISHQIRTPLTSINLLLSLLSEPGITPGRHQALARELYDLLSRIDWLITALLKISKLDAGTVQFKKETVSLEALVKQASAPLLVPIELREQTLTIDARGEFTGDIAWTVEAIGNIVKNCMEHTPSGGAVTITARENALFSEITVRDTGSGIAPEDLPHIFERFYKGKDSDDKSFGIGLALSRTIIIGQNGTVKAENAVPTGAQFTIRFYKGTV